MEHVTTDEIVRGYESLCGDGGAAVVERDVIAVTGPDAARYLQGQLSQDVVAMEGDSAWSLLLAPSGKVEAWIRVHRRDPEDYLIEVDAGWGDATVARLRRFLLRTKAQISDPQVWTLVERRWDPAIVRLGHDAPEGAIMSPATGPGIAGVELLVPPGSDAAVRDAAAERVPDESMERYRIAHGVPRMGRELTTDTIPAEGGQWLIDASVSFTKGCYTGQELVARIDSRGNNVPHPIRLLVLDVGGVDASIGQPVMVGESEVGEITSAVPSLGDSLPSLALARVSRSVAVGDVVEVGPAGGPSNGATVVESATVH